jgi:hypothetical protein
MSWNHTQSKKVLKNEEEGKNIWENGKENSNEIQVV